MPSGVYKRVKPVWNKGLKGCMKYTKERNEKISKAHIGMQKPWAALSGSKSPSWKGGISKIDKLCRRMKEYLQWCSDVFQRDNWTCKTCGKNGCYVTAHHIKSFSKIIKENHIKNILDARRCRELWNINNDITLCEDCHKLTDNYKGRAIKK